MRESADQSARTSSSSACAAAAWCAIPPAPAADAETVAPRCAGCDVREPHLADHLVGEPQPEPPQGPSVDDARRRARGDDARRALGVLDGASWTGACAATPAAQVCPMCFCERCVADKTQPQWIETSPHARGNLAWHITRALHLAGRCVDCGECERACPAGIPLGLLNRKIAAVVADRFGYTRERRPVRAGADRRLSAGRRAGVHPVSTQQNVSSQSSLPSSWPTSLAAGTRVIAPATAAATAATRAYACASAPRSTSAALGGPLPLPARSRSFFLPPTEALFRWRQEKGDVEVEPVPIAFAEQRHPRRRGRATPPRWRSSTRHGLGLPRRAVVRAPRGHHDRRVACPGIDERLLLHCRRARARLDAGRRRAADAGRRRLLVEVAHAKGEAAPGAHAARFAEARPRPAAAAKPPARGAAEVDEQSGVDTGRRRALARRALRARLLAARSALRCHGCGACASVCPTCHCFDIVDEPEGVDSGTRRRNWDTCQTAQFTLHASRPQPAQRPERALPPARDAQVRIYPAGSAKSSAPAAAAARGRARPAWTCREVLAGRSTALGEGRRAPERGQTRHEPLPAAPGARSPR